MIPVQDPEDPRLAPYRRLRRGAQRPDPDFVVAEGEIAVARLVASGLRLESALATPASAARLAPSLPAGCPLFVAEAGLLSAVVGHEFHRGCCAAAARPAAGEPDLAPLAARGRSLTLALEGLADPVNVGALVRSARAFACDLVLVDARGADPFVPRALRASMGQALLQPLAIARDLPRAVERARAALGARVLAATPDAGALPLPGLEPAPHDLVLLGNEGQGLSARLLALADLRVRIPIAPEADSLNVAAAGAVLLYALRRGGRTSEPG